MTKAPQAVEPIKLARYGLARCFRHLRPRLMRGVADLGFSGGAMGSMELFMRERRDYVGEHIATHGNVIVHSHSCGILIAFKDGLEDFFMFNG